MVPVAVCFFLSGAAALILQVLWTRMLGHVFGATALAVSTTLTVFMGGLALGSHFGGRWAPRLRRPLLAFAVLESAVGVYGLLVPSLLETLPGLQRGLSPDALGFWGYAALRFVVVLLILLVPTTAMGATLPVLSEGVVRRRDRIASEVGALYTANTFGAVAGAMVAGFVLIPQLGMTLTVYVAAAVDVAVAILVAGLFGFGGASALTRSVFAPRLAGAEVLDDLEREDAPRIVPLSDTDRRRALTVFALSGAAAMALEVLWTRTIGVVIGASTYSFTLILTTFLVGLAAGAAWMTRRIDRIRDPVRTLAYVQLTVGISAIFASQLVDRMPRWLHAVARAQDVTIGQLYFANFFISASVMLPSTLALGAVFPLVVKILAPHGAEHAGPIVGRAYALNTVGAIAGSFLAGFVILPTIGVERGVGLAAVVSLAVGVWLTLGRPKARLRASAVALLGVAVVLFAPRWDVRGWTAGLFRMYLARHVYSDGWTPTGNVVYHRDGLATTVTVERQLDGVGVALKVNGKVDASDIGDMPTQVLSGLLPVMLHPNPKEVLVIGYGSGVTPGAVLQAPIARLQVAEIEAAVYEASNRHFAHVNHQPDRDPRTTLTVDDGRNFLRTRNDRYDIIISEPSNPWMTGAASLFTTDFFAIAAERLNEDGIFLQWLQLYELSTQNVHTLVRTFNHVFEHVLIFTPDRSSNDMLLIGAKRPLIVDYDRVERWMKDPKMRAELARAEFEGPADLFALLLLDDARFANYIGTGPLNTDDNALIEFAAPKDLLTYATRDARLPFVSALEGRREALLGTVFTGFQAPWTPLAKRLIAHGRYADAAAIVARARRAGEPETRRLQRIVAAAEGPDTEPVIVADESTTSDIDYARVAKAMLQQRERDALVLAQSVEYFWEQGTAHRFLSAFLYYRHEQYDAAKFLFEAVLKDERFVRAYPSSLYYAARAHIYSADFREGAALLDRYVATSTSAE